MLEKILTSTSVSVQSTPDDPIYESDNGPASSGVYYVFSPLDAEAELVDDPNGDGLVVPADQSFVSGPWRTESGERPRFLRRVGGSSDFTVDVLVVESGGSDTFVHGPLDSGVSSVSLDATKLEGSASPSGNETPIDGFDYLDVSGLSNIEFRASSTAGTDPTIRVYTKLTQADDDKQTASVTITADGSFQDVSFEPVDTVNYVKVTTDYSATVVAGGS